LLAFVTLLNTLQYRYTEY